MPRALIGHAFPHGGDLPAPLAPAYPLAGISAASLSCIDAAAFFFRPLRVFRSRHFSAGG